METKEYFENFKKQVDEVYEVAEKARAKGFDPVNKVEIPLAMSMAEKVVGLISMIYPQMMESGIAERILNLEKEYGKLDSTVVFKIAEEVAKQKFCEFDDMLQAIDAGIRIGFAYVTLGVVSSPIEGFTGLKIRKTKDGKDYLEASFSGPIRSAGTTASCVVLMLIDYLREIFGFAKYDPSEDEIKRFSTELTDFHERVTNLQYMPTEEEMEFLAKNMPIQIAGDASEKMEVSNYKNLDRVETNYLRSGFCLILAEGLAQKAAKGFRLLNKSKSDGIKSSGFDFLKEYVELHEKRNLGESDSSPTYIKDLVAGRPIFGHPSRSGGFRFRYGRGRVSGFSATSVHSATMGVSDNFIATGTQLKIEKPTKGCAVTVCDSIDGPIVKLKNGSVKKLTTKHEAKKIYNEIEEIIYLGDMLFPFSDVLNRNYDLVKPGYVEEWWKLELEKNGFELKDFDFFNVGFEEAIRLSKKYNVPLYPGYIFYWTEISKDEFFSLVDWLKHSKVSGKIIFPFDKFSKEKFEDAKRALELLGIEHEVTLENVVLNEENTKALFVNLGLNLEILNKNDFSLFEIIDKNNFSIDGSVLEIVNKVSKFEIKDKAGEFIGTRMGRPEKAKLRKLQGSPNILFPVGVEGGRFRSVNEACNVGKIRSSFPINYCEKCEKESIFLNCEVCGSECKKMYYCFECGDKFSSKCEEHERGDSFMMRDLDINSYFDSAVKRLGLKRSEIPVLIKGLKSMSSEEKIPENLVKGILRAKYNLQVNKDGTIRFDVTELPLVSFKPKEIGVSVDKLKELGYDKDVYGKLLVEENQILEIMPHDVLLPCPEESPDDKADDVFWNICNFMDEMLEKFYGVDKFHHVKTRDDLVGQLGVCMAPHNCAGVVCRFIGFSNTQGGFASPYMHAAVRRDCFAYDTYIPVKENGFWKIKKIGELVEELKPTNIVDKWETKEKKVTGFETIGKDLDSVKINKFTKHSKREMYEIKTALGKKIKVSENHKFLVDGKIKRANNLKIGDKLPLPIHIKIKERKIDKINLLEELKDEPIMVRYINKILSKLSEDDIFKIINKLKINKKVFRNYQNRDSYPVDFVLSLKDEIKKEIYSIGKIAAKRDNVELPIVIELRKDLLELIGLYIAEGYSRSVEGKKGLNQVYISSNDANLRKFIKKVVYANFGIKPSENKDDRVTFSSKIFYLFFIKILGCGSRAKDKRIPSRFLNLKKEKLACMLRGYYEGDGSVSFSDRRVSCDSVSEGLLYDLEFCLNRFSIFVKRYEYSKQPGQRLKEFYIKKKRKIPEFSITKLIIGSDFVENFFQIGFLSNRKNKILDYHSKRKGIGMRIEKDDNFVYDPIVSIEDIGEHESYCLNVDSKEHLVIANNMLSFQCDGDEFSFMLLSDVLINFSRKFLPSHRGGTQDAPLVLNAKIDAGEVDDQILDFEMCNEYPLELYEKAEKKLHSSEVNIPIVKDILKEGKDPFVNVGFTHDTSNFNSGVICSSYKLLATMAEKVEHQMQLVEKIRAVDTSDTARLIIERHFIRDIRGNLRKFSMQGFRCVKCNEIFRRPPLTGICLKCKGKIIFTIHEGGIKKYLNIALELAEKYELSSYIKQSLELTKRYIDSVFGKELEQQKNLTDWTD